MPGSVVHTSLPFGYPGYISHGQNHVTDPKTVKKNTADIPFGSAVILNTDNTVQLADGNLTADNFGGIAVAEVKQMNTYGPNMGQASGYFSSLQKAGILKEGIVPVKVGRGTPTAGGKVYIRTVLNSAYPAAKLGDFESSSDAGKNVVIPSLSWFTGKVDSRGVAELRLKYANN